MKIGMTLSLVGGILTLIVGIIIVLFVGAIGRTAGVFGATDAAAKSGIAAIILLGLPIMAIVGGAMTFNNPQASIWLNGIPGTVIALFGLVAEQNMLMIILGGLLLAAALFIYNASRAQGVGSNKRTEGN